MVGGKKKAAASVEPLKTKESSEPPQYSRWLMKSEPESRFEKEIDLKVQSLISTACFPKNVSGLHSFDACCFILQFGIEELKALPDQTGCWDGVRNYQVNPHNWLLL